MKIILNTKDLPDWLGGGDLGVDILFDERSYLEMAKALKIVGEAKGNRLAELRSILLGNLESRFQPISNKVLIDKLNESQNQAVEAILAGQDVIVVHGPPGTGKTTTLVQAIKKIVEREQTVLVSAPSNAAVDWMTMKLLEEGLEVVRVGNIGRMNEDIIRHTLDAKLAEHPESKHIKKVKIQAAEFRRQARRFKRKFGSIERAERKHLFQEARELSAWANQLEDRLIDNILSSAQVISCTLVGANHPVLEGRKFRTVVIDEAAQALEPACWIPITKASRVVMAGDPFQLPPTIKSNEARKGGLEKTLIEKCIGHSPNVQ